MVGAHSLPTRLSPAWDWGSLLAPVTSAPRPAAHDGRDPLSDAGLSYLPRFMSHEEAETLGRELCALHPLWERRHVQGEHLRHGGGSGRITRPVYWLGAWQFASLGYYAEPDYREHRCLRAEPFTPMLATLLERLRPRLERHHGDAQDPASQLPLLPNTCLVNYYGSELARGQPPVDRARLRPHRDGEPGPVIMFCLGQPGLLEFSEMDRVDAPQLALWTRHRAAVIFSGPHYKDHLYHRIRQVRHGAEPALPSPVEDFALRRISISFRHVPERLISNFDELPAAARDTVRPYIEELAQHSTHFAAQLRRETAGA